jgi:nitrogen fixation/metabolism regulation signal transduction histidine kinase
MKIHVEYGSEFKRQFKRLAKKYHSLKSDYDAWLDEIYKNPLVGDDLGGGVRKIRMTIADKGKGKSGGARILTLNVKQETAQREKYYELIMDFVETGIVVLNSKGSVYQKNKEAMNLLGLDVLTHVKQLSRISDELMTALEKAVPGDKLQIQFNTERGTVHLALRVSGIRIKDEELRIIALSDINRELDEREIDSWIRLTRVLTHEIMNSLTPVTSLSETLLALPGAENEEMKQGLETIHSTGKGLINFVMSYRKLTRLPSPEPSLFYVRPFLERMIRLAQHQHPCPNITLSILEAREDLIVFADENLIAQVVTNLLKNAIQAIGNAPDGKITLKAYCDPQESIRIEIANNGPAIPPDAAGQIFVPFFTTKEEGSGIGLSLSKQIMRLSGGTLTLLPYKEKGQATVFVLVFN